MDIILFLVIGALAGFLAGKVMKGKGFGLVGNLIVGIIGICLGFNYWCEFPWGNFYIIIGRK